MKDHLTEIWFTPEGQRISPSLMLDHIKKHILNNGKLYIGTDSTLDFKKCTFATTICLHGADLQQGGTYFWKRIKTNPKRFSQISTRMFKETSYSVEVALNLMDRYPLACIELHLDIASQPKEKTFKYVESLTGYVKGSGFNCKIKPDSWASSSVADKHSK